MNAPRRLLVTLGAVVAALSLNAGPVLAAPSSTPAPIVVLAVEDGDEPAPASDDEGDHRISLTDTPRDRFSLLMWGVLIVGGGVALVNARRQLKGEREQATGEFRWR